MEGNPRVSKHFFKVMSRDFHTKLALPKAFCRNLNVEKLAIITSGKGIWKVNISKSNRDTVFFEEGWGDFVRQHDLDVGDIVVFEHIGEMHFNAFVFDLNTACEKEFDKDLEGRNEGSARRLPIEFWKSNGLKEKTSVILRDPSGNNWSVELKFYKKGSKCCVLMHAGWKQFYESNKLKIGDVCTFELNHNPKVSSTASMDLGTRALPKAFCRFLNVDKLANITSGKGSWNVNVRQGSDGMMCFEEGWADFVRKHCLTVGDIVVFKHIGEMHFKAFVFDLNTACEKEFDKDLASNEGASSQRRDNPYFVITMQHYNSPDCKRNRPCVHIPAEFWKSNGLNKKTSVNLRDPLGKKWSVELKIYKSYGNGRVIMGRGWKQFYESNKLKIGDVCTFELLGNNPKGSSVASMDVHILPAPI
ncbi:B3 domain-containing protein REM14 [Forsythia ovata]|uniref:B3 domain-containing protein REM14 n=1 Tax=Forsythia ovata TaxID=205694 RepID=A0ABD1TMN2_9LAMI